MKTPVGFFFEAFYRSGFFYLLCRDYDRLKCLFARPAPQPRRQPVNA